MKKKKVEQSFDEQIDDLMEANYGSVVSFEYYNATFDLKTIFTVDDVENVEEISPYEGKWLKIDDNYKVRLPDGELTWLSLWIAVDKCYRMSPNKGHMWIEDFTEVSNDTIECFLGS